MALLLCLLGARAFVVAHRPRPPRPCLVGRTVALAPNSQAATLDPGITGLVLQAFHNEGATAPVPGQEPDILVRYEETGTYYVVIARCRGEDVGYFRRIDYLPFLDETVKCSQGLIRRYARKY